MRAVPSRAYLFIVCCTFPFVLVSAKNGWNPSDLPSPQQDRRDVCRRGKKSAVCDPNSILTLRERDELDGLMNFIAEGTNGNEKAPCGERYEGYQLAVLIIDRMSSSYYRFHSTAQRAKQFAKDIHDKWAVGDAECHNGVVIFVSIDDRQMYISTGKGTREALTNSKVHSVLACMRPYMREEAYGRALFCAVQGIGKTRTARILPTRQLSGGGLGLFGWFVLALLACCCCWGVYRCCFGGAQSARERKKQRKPKAQLKRTDDDMVSGCNGTYWARNRPTGSEESENKNEDSEDEARQIWWNMNNENSRVRRRFGGGQPARELRIYRECEDPDVLAEASSAGSAGSTFSFGGSSSADSGGGGSSW